MRPSPLGLTLTRTPSFLDLVNVKLSQEKITPLNEPTSSTRIEKQKTKDDKYNIQHAPMKWKASNFPATRLKIGCWERRSENEGDIVAKFYYAKRKLVWEILENGLKQKLEIQWPDISAIRAHLIQNQPDILEVELRQQPMFFTEVNPQPRKHTNWEACSDFTEGNAARHRRHNLEFPEGTLEKHYEKLLHSDKRLLTLSQRDLASDDPLFCETIDNEMQDICMIKPKFSPTFNQPSSNWYPPHLHHINNQRSLNAPTHIRTYESLDPLVGANHPLPLLKPTVEAIQMNSPYSGQGTLSTGHTKSYWCSTDMGPVPSHEPSIPSQMLPYQSIPNHSVQSDTVVDLGGGLPVHLTDTPPIQYNLHRTEPFQLSTNTAPVSSTTDFSSAMEFSPTMDQATIVSNAETSYLAMEFSPTMDQATIVSNPGTSYLADNFAVDSGNSTMKPILNKMTQFCDQDSQSLKRVDVIREHQGHQLPSGAYTPPAPDFLLLTHTAETENPHFCIEGLPFEHLFNESNDLDAFDFYDPSLLPEVKSSGSHLGLAALPDSQSQFSNGLDGNQNMDGTNSSLELRGSKQFDNNNEQIDASGLFQRFDHVNSLQ